MLKVGRKQGHTLQVSSDIADSLASASAAGGGSVGSRNRLQPAFRVRDGVALIVSNVIGVGIFTTPAIVAKLVPHPGAILLLWLAGGCLALAGAMSYAQLGRMWPLAGGEYIYLSKAYGPTAGFLSGWTSLVAGFSGAVAASAVGLITYLGQYFPSLALDHSLFAINFYVGGGTFSPRSLAAAAVIVLFATLHACNLGAGKLTQNTLALLIVAIIVVFCVLGFAVGAGSWAHFRSPNIAFRPVNWLLALIPIMFTYSGWNAASYIAEEMYVTRRTIGQVLMIGTCIIVGLYVAL